MAVAALQRVVRLHPLPLALRQVLAQGHELSRVSIEPKMWPQTSFEACILRAILLVQSCGTWQSGQAARTPERFVKWIVPLQLLEDVGPSSRGSRCRTAQCWSPPATVLKPPQKKTPARKPPSVRKARLRVRAGENA